MKIQLKCAIVIEGVRGGGKTALAEHLTEAVGQFLLDNGEHDSSISLKIDSIVRLSGNVEKENHQMLTLQLSKSLQHHPLR